MFAEMLSHSEEKIFLEAIDQYFETSTEFESEYNNSFKEESDESLTKIAFDISDLLNKENNSNESKQSLMDNNNLSGSKKYLVIHQFININKKIIDDFKNKIYNIYKSQLKE